MTDFTLDERLSNSSHLIDIHHNIEIRLADDERFFWLLLIPQTGGLKEWHQIPSAQMQVMHSLMTKISRKLEIRKQPDKINIGALGNIVSQFHLHIVLRYKDDTAWPGPIWGNGTPVPLTAEEKQDRMALIRAILAE